MNFRTILINTIVTLSCCTILFVLIKKDDKKIGMVDAVKLFAQYNMKKELEQQVESRFRYLEAQRDSIGEYYSSVSVANSNSPKDEIMSSYKAKQQQIEEEYAMSNQQINEVVWKRLNPLIEEFGKHHNMRLIIGANGMGSVLYHDDYYDMTEELILFVNEKYENSK